MDAVAIPSSILDVSRAAFPRGGPRALYNTAPQVRPVFARTVWH